MYNNQETGKIGENLVCQFLKQKGYIILGRNFRCKQGEIDIITKDTTNEEIVFIEVKTRKSFLYGYPAEAVNMYKQKHIGRSIKYYIYKNRIQDIPIRVDVVEVIIRNNKVYINHIINAIDF